MDELVEHWTSVQEVPGSNPNEVSTCLNFGEKLLLLDWAKSCGFLNSPSQELSEYIVFVPGLLISTSLELRDQCRTDHNAILAHF